VEKRKQKQKLNDKQAAEKKKKRQVTKRVGCPELWRVGERHSLERGELVTVAVMWKDPLERGERHSPTQIVNKQG
jgi:hypothetical protein